MTAIICVDDRDGIMFNHRRVSRDETVTEYIIQIIEHSGRALVLSPYSAKLLAPAAEGRCHVEIREHPLEVAGPAGVCFIEDGVAELNACPDGLDRVIVFGWGRNYPADEYFDHAAVLSGWELVHQEEFSGKSHENITLEVYTHAQD